VGTLRERLWRVAAGVQVQPRQVTVMVAAAWPAAATGQAVQAAVTAHVAALTGGRTTGPPATARPPG
jgi:hypothetical protein